MRFSGKSQIIPDIGVDDSEEALETFFRGLLEDDFVHTRLLTDKTETLNLKLFGFRESFELAVRRISSRVQSNRHGLGLFFLAGSWKLENHGDNDSAG